MKEPRHLTSKQKFFAIEYLKDFNATQAAIRAGYSKKTAYSIGEENLRKPEIKNLIAKKMEERGQRLEVDADSVLKRLVEIDEMDLLDILNDDLSIKPLNEWSDVWRKTVTSLDIVEQISNINGERELVSFVKKLKLPDKLKNLDLIGRHVNVQAWKTKFECDIKQNMSLEEIAKQMRHERLVG